MSKLTFQQRGKQDTRIPVGQRRAAGGKALEDNRAVFAAKQLKQGDTAQLTKEEDELLKGKSGTKQLAKKDEEKIGQAKFSDRGPPVQREQQPAKPNNTGLPDKLKNGIESLSGMSMDKVKVHYNSAKPAQLDALAYAQGTNIHVGPGQEKHLPHEAWHVVQQAQGRVKPTMQIKGRVPVNDDKGLESEADVMGERAMESIYLAKRMSPRENLKVRDTAIQLKWTTFSDDKRSAFWDGDDGSPKGKYFHIKDLKIFRHAESKAIYVFYKSKLMPYKGTEDYSKNKPKEINNEGTLMAGGGGYGRGLDKAYTEEGTSFNLEKQTLQNSTFYPQPYTGNYPLFAYNPVNKTTHYTQYGFNYQFPTSTILYNTPVEPKNAYTPPISTTPKTNSMTIEPDDIKLGLINKGSSRSQNQVMGGKSATNQIKQLDPSFKDSANWSHGVAYSFSYKNAQTQNNLMATTAHANTWMMAVEGAVKQYILDTNKKVDYEVKMNGDKDVASEITIIISQGGHQETITINPAANLPPDLSSEQKTILEFLKEKFN